MTFLASLLPGVREVRSALFAGYLWLAIAYVVVEVWFNDNSGTPFDILQARLAETPQVWEFIAASVAAYFVGSISRAICDPILLYFVDTSARGVPTSRERFVLTSAQGFSPASTRAERFARSRDRLRLALDPRISFGQRIALETFLREQWTARLQVLHRIALAYPIGALETVPKRLQSNADRVMRLLPWDVQEGVRDLQGFDQRSIRGKAPEVILCESVLSDIPVMRTRLLSSNAPQLYAEMDRHENEAELRTAVFIPLIVAGLILCFDYWMWGGLLLMAGAAVFFFQGLMRRREARDVVVQALIAGAVESPRLSALVLEFGDLAEQLDAEEVDQQRLRAERLAAEEQT